MLKDIIIAYRQKVVNEFKIFFLGFQVELKTQCHSNWRTQEYYVSVVSIIQLYADVNCSRKLLL